ncbi:sigma-54-dependent Fis family transcriptional regulator [Acidovorax soli]|uniref:Transcriptional regulator of acetoin/glycerol metabolism n=1 Tax=Acidovorax soli TaxID=592050 RepID=A0A1H4EBI2_9BURK|nr:sigma-54-dependent Fis family transcriptional regulator [Acidovorax soli]SEA82404.1 Transcriptional regulator of acetoin/glycerol metabolism [Acidovorax soli]
METRLVGQANVAPEQDAVALIDQAHLRSKAFGIASDDRPDYSGLAASHLKGALEENRFLFQHAVPVMETLYGQIANTHSMVLLTSAQGMVLHSMGDNDFLEKADRVALVPGMDWSEQTRGTNAVGTALATQHAVTVHGDQHYMNANHALTCSCAPILDPYGQIVGALDVSGDHRSYHQHTLALVRMSAQMIENHMFASSFPKAVRVHFHSRPEFLGTLVEGIAAFTPEGRFVSANRSAQFQLGMSFVGLQAHTFPSLFNLPISALFELFGSPNAAPRQLCLHNGVTVWCRTEVKPSGPWATPIVSPLADSGTPAARSSCGNGNAARTTQLSSLQYLDTGDAQLSGVIAKLRKVVDRDIPVMILGETGTGKDLLAQAIHHDSARARQPFVAVNCASIPDTLIEAELFGYEEGAFTGARKKGAPGKIQQAHGGTLFLDEIGDMPKHLQARLLRVLQERKVSPLGAGKEVEVDVTVISATHKNLKELIARGDFREDLYYRLNGLVVRLPALRERSDFEVVVKKVLHALDGGVDIAIAPEVMELLQAYHWPGNVRQLHNLLRTATVMVDDDGIIRLAHLPDDFLDELRAPLRPVAIPLPAEEPPLVPCVGAPPAPAADDPGEDNQSLQDVTINAMAQMLRLHKGNVSAAAKALGVSRNTIYRKKNLLPPDLLD